MSLVCLAKTKAMTLKENNMSEREQEIKMSLLADIELRKLLDKIELEKKSKLINN